MITDYFDLIKFITNVLLKSLQLDSNSAYESNQAHMILISPSIGCTVASIKKQMYCQNI